MKSKKNSLNKEDLTKLCKGLGIALGGSALAYVVQVLPTIDWGQWSYIAIPLAAVVVNVGRKFLSK